MATLEPFDKGTPTLLPSLPPSPIEEDLTKADGIWNDEPTSTSAKWKGKAREVSEQSDVLPLNMREDAPLGSATSEAYPPMNDDDAETRQVEENLRRWEVAERQRRKAARESQTSSQRPGSAGSTFGEVARRASLLWTSRRTSRSNSSGAGTHAPLRARASVSEDGVQLDTIDDEAGSIPNPTVHSPARSPQLSASAAQGVPSPFDDPSEGAAPGPLMRADSTASIRPAIAERDKLSEPNPIRPTLEAANSFSGPSLPPPPIPFDLPPPRTPPPRTATPHANRPPEPHPPLDVESARRERELDEEARKHNNRDVRWWSDWLCGCGPSKNDTRQDARTNPFE